MSQQGIQVIINGTVKFDGIFTVLPTPPPDPVITDMQPTSGVAGSAFRFTGANIPQTGVVVVMGGLSCNPVVAADGTFIDCTVPNLPA